MKFIVSKWYFSCGVLATCLPIPMCSVRGNSGIQVLCVIGEFFFLENYGCLALSCICIHLAFSLDKNLTMLSQHKLLC